MVFSGNVVEGLRGDAASSLSPDSHHPRSINYTLNKCMESCSKNNNFVGTSGDFRQMSYVFQGLSVITQRFNSILMHERFLSADEEPDL